MQSSTPRSEAISIIIRCRPLSESEVSRSYQKCVQIDSSESTIEIFNPKNTKDRKRFTYDKVYDTDASQEEIYESSFASIVKLSIDGFNSTILAYGQTGTGKTFTTMGDIEDPTYMGIIPRAFRQIFDHIQQSEDQEFLIRVSYLEIYMEKLRDLLNVENNKPLEIHDNSGQGVSVSNLSSIVTRSLEEINQALLEGNENRVTASTDMNLQSSRSHAIFMITIESTKQLSPRDNGSIKIGRLNIVDLAGSERQKKTKSENDRLKEAIKINLSLLTLANVISSLTSENPSHVPYRDSKLTRILQDSFGGNSKTVMIGNIGPSGYNYDETLNTLRYASRAKKIQNKPQVNFNAEDGLLREYLMEIERLKEELRQKKLKKSAGNTKTQPGSPGVNGLVVLEETGERLANEKEATLQMQQRLFQMESKLIYSGGQKKILEQLEDNNRVLAKNYEELEKHKTAEEEFLEKISNETSKVGELEKNVSNLNEEVSLASKRLRKLLDRFQLLTLDYDRIEEQNHSERREVEKEQEELLQQIKFKTLIIDNFIPAYELKKLKSRLYIDPKTKKWTIRPALECIAKEPESFHPWNVEKSLSLSIPRCLYAKHNEDLSDDARYKMRNIHKLDLIEPIPTVHESLPPTLPQEILNLIENAFNEENTSHVINTLQL